MLVSCLISTLLCTPGSVQKRRTKTVHTNNINPISLTLYAAQSEKTALQKCPIYSILTQIDFSSFQLLLYCYYISMKVMSFSTTFPGKKYWPQLNQVVAGKSWSSSTKSSCWQKIKFLWEVFLIGIFVSPFHGLLLVFWPKRQQPISHIVAGRTDDDDKREIKKQAAILCSSSKACLPREIVHLMDSLNDEASEKLHTTSDMQH